MPITEHARQRRRNYVGSSDAAAILGRDPYGRTRQDIYYEKTAELAENGTTAAMDTGNRLESPLLDFASERIGLPIRKNQFRVADNGIQASNLDAIVIGANEGVEGKVTSIIDDWGDDGTDAVNTYTALQCQHHMAVSGFDAIWVPLLYVHFRVEWRLYKVPRSQEIIDILTEHELKFWKEHVEPRIPPSLEPPSMGILKRLIREPASTIDLDDEALVAWEAREVQRKALKVEEDAYEQATARVLNLLGNNEVGKCPDGRLLCYIEENAGERLIDSKQAKALHPDLFQPSTRRVLRLKKGPK